MDLLNAFFNTKTPTLFDNKIVNHHIRISPGQTATLAETIGEIGKLNKFFIQLQDKNIPVILYLDNQTISYTPEELYNLGKVVKMNDEFYLSVYNDESIPNNYIINFESPAGNSFFINAFGIRVTNTTSSDIILSNKSYSIDYSIVIRPLQSQLFNILKGVNHG